METGAAPESGHARPVIEETSSPPATASRAWQDRALWLLARLLRPAALGPLALAFGACLPLAWLTAGPSFCPFKVMTGLPCPGCGMTRSVVALLHGDATTSFYFHPLGVPLVLVVVLLALADAWIWWRAGRPGALFRPPSWLLERVMQTPLPWVAIGALAVVWLIRLPLYAIGTWTF